MKTKLLTILFILMITVFGVLNLKNDAASARSFFCDYLFGKGVEGVSTSKEMIRKVEDDYNENFVPKMAFVELQGLTRKALGSNYYNTVLRLKNGYFTYQYDDIDVKKRADSVLELKEYVENKGKEFLYVAVPFKVSPEDQEKVLPAGAYEKSNENQDRMLKYLEDGNATTVDLRSYLIRENSDWYDAFFRTDQHWRPETAFWAYGRMSEFFKDEYGLKEDERSKDISNYTIEKYEDWFLGSQGKKTGRIYTGLDDFSLIYPKFKTKMTVEVPKHNEVRKGSFKKVMIKKSRLRKDYYNVNNYAAYMGGDYPFCIQKNDSAANDKKILVLKDSFTVAFQPYLSFLFKEVEVVDLREFTGQDRKLSYYLDKYDPDYVMVFYTSSMMSYDEAFEFGI